MTPEERLTFLEMQQTIKRLEQVLDIAFIEQIKRRAVQPELLRVNVAQAISKNTTGATTGTTQAVNESGSSSYTVPAAFDGTITVEDVDGNTYKLGYYNT